MSFPPDKLCTHLYFRSCEAAFFYGLSCSVIPGQVAADIEVPAVVLAKMAPRCSRDPQLLNFLSEDGLSAVTSWPSSIPSWVPDGHPQRVQYLPFPCASLKNSDLLIVLVFPFPQLCFLSSSFR